MILLKCIIGPRLYRFHQHNDDGPSHSRHSLASEYFGDDNARLPLYGKDYEPGALENGANSVIRWLRFLKAVCQWTSPVILTYLYRKEYFTPGGCYGLSKTLGGLLLVYMFAVFLRAVSRSLNPQYVEFMNVLHAAKRDYTNENKAALHKYDSDIFPWPVDYRWDDSKALGERKQYTPKEFKPPMSILQRITSVPSSILGYCAIHTFGRRMVFPGATCIQALFAPRLNIGRAVLIEDKNGQRAKLKARDGNTIDTMFVDRRNQEQYPNGNTLVICSEGNAGFYEIGCMATPLDAGYSVIGWNHPGFSNSTGVPFPSQEQSAIDVVVQFVLEKLDFKLQDVVLFSWSIGGYASTYAAMSYPDVKHVILDATFDDLIPLAIPKMPQSLKGLVTSTLRKYMNLDNAEQLCKYPGPVLIIRRSRDEMITTQDGVLATNRGNDLLVKLLQCRYPNLLDDSTLGLLHRWLAADRSEQTLIWSDYAVDNALCEQTVKSYVQETESSYPLHLGDDLDQNVKNQLVLYLASKYMDNFDAPHGLPLPSIFIREPWSEFPPRQSTESQPSHKL